MNMVLKFYLKDVNWLHISVEPRVQDMQQNNSPTIPVSVTYSTYLGTGGTSPDMKTVSHTRLYRP